jgi:alpha-glucosidase
MQSDDWWRGATVYQIYPRSFADSNGDGIGDLPGITAHLPYVASLGVDAVWLSPFFTSPMRDFGYDVSDHRGVDPMFGTLADFDALVDRAHALGLKVIIDQVWSHSALEHPWFQASRASRDNPMADWYVWADAKDDGSPPTNWQSWMGCGTWTWEPRRRQYYLHNFLPQMPDLNFHSLEVQDAALDIARFWLDRGVDGFRLDTANYYCHDRSLRDNPPQPPDKRGHLPAAMQQHLHNVCQPETPLFFERVRAVMDSYGHGDGARMTVAEIGSQHSLQRMVEYTRGRDRLHTAYSFLLLGPQPTARALADMLAHWQVGEGAAAWPSWAVSNHDVPRVATRWAAGDPARVRQCLALLASLRGTLFLYQGEELGLEQSVLAYADLQDPFGRAHWPADSGRDGCRTPMPWRADAPAAGFSTGRPWLPVDPAHARRAVAVQEADPQSMLQLTRRLLALRRSHAALRLGSFEPLHVAGTLLLALRRHAQDTLLVAFNLGSESLRHTLPVALATAAAAEQGHPGVTVNGALLQGRQVLLPPWSALLWPIEPRTDPSPWTSTAPTR